MKNITSLILLLLATSIAYSQNLILNPSAEEPLVNGEIPFWTEMTGNSWTISGIQSFGQGLPPANSGLYFFTSGFNNVNGIAELAQTIDISPDATDIDLGVKHYYFSGYTISYNQNPPDQSNFIFEFLDANNSILNTVHLGPFSTTTIWNHVEHDLLTPINSKKIKIKLQSQLINGSSCDGNYDQLYLGHSPLSSLGINDIDNKEFSIYPNPTKGIITISSDENTPVDKIEIVDILGKTVSLKTKNTFQIDISEFSNGIYILKIHSGESVFQKKIMKQ